MIGPDDPIASRRVSVPELLGKPKTKCVFSCLVGGPPAHLDMLMLGPFMIRVVSVLTSVASLPAVSRFSNLCYWERGFSSIISVTEPLERTDN